MITLTPEEAREYETGGPLAAIRAFRYRTNLGLIDSKRCVEAWLAAGKPIAADGKLALDASTLEKLSDAMTRLREAEQVISQQRRTAIEIVRRIMLEAGQQEEAQQNTWGRACERIMNALGEELHS
jgi:hypothetical protein